MKILQIVESLHNGAVENWLVNCFVEISKIKPDWQWTFFCIIENEGKLEHLVKKNGGKVLKSPVTISDKKNFRQNLSDLSSKMEFDIIHAHHDYMNAFYLLSFHNSKAYKISHIHNTDKHLPIRNRVVNRLLIPALRIINNIGYDRIIGISQDTIKEFKMALNIRAQKNILYYGIELEKFNLKYDKDKFLLENNLPSNAIVLLFIGRFTSLKNPSFLVEILHELYNHFDIPFYALFVGEGDEKNKIIQKAKEFNLVDKIRISRWVENPEKYFQLADVFVFPRVLKPIEGFGIVMLEAQAAGIPIIVSRGVSKETIVIKDIVEMMDSVSNPKQWAKEIVKKYKISHLQSSLEIMKSSSFNIQSSASKLIDIYEFKA
jgi:glycosyltransferase EpsF